MAYENLKSAIKQAIKQNGNQEITGNLLQSTLLNIVNTLGAEYKFLGFANSSTVPPTSEEGRLLYFTTGHGDSYINFPTSASGTYITLEYGIYALTREANSKYWRSDVVVPIVHESGNANDKVMSQKAVTDNFAKEANRVDNINSGTGIIEYPNFSESEKYDAGDIVNYNGKIKVFITKHEEGKFSENEVRDMSLREDITMQINSCFDILNGNDFPDKILGKEIFTIYNKYISSEGVEKDFNGCLSTDYIDVSNYARLRVSMSAIASIKCVAYDENKNLLSIFSSNDNGKNIYLKPQNAKYVKYMRFSCSFVNLLQQKSNIYPKIYLYRDTFRNVVLDADLNPYVKNGKHVPLYIQIIKNSTSEYYKDAIWIRTNKNLPTDDGIIGIKNFGQNHLAEGLEIVKLNEYNGSGWSGTIMINWDQVSDCEIDNNPRYGYVEEVPIPSVYFVHNRSIYLQENVYDKNATNDKIAESIGLLKGIDGINYIKEAYLQAYNGDGRERKDLYIQVFKNSTKWPYNGVWIRTKKGTQVFEDEIIGVAQLGKNYDPTGIKIINIGNFGDKKYTGYVIIDWDNVPDSGSSYGVCSDAVGNNAYSLLSNPTLYSYLNKNSNNERIIGFGINGKWGNMKYANLLDADYSAILCYGQSFAFGTSAKGISNDSVENTYMLGNSTDNYSSTQLNPLKVSSGGREYPVVGCVHSLEKLYNQIGEKPSLVAITGGAGGRCISAMSKGTSFYTNFVNALTNLKTAANSDSGKKSQLLAIFYMQGESDYSPNDVDKELYTNDKDTYKERLLKLKNDMQEDAMSILGQSKKPLFFIYQTGGNWIRRDKNTGDDNGDMPITQAQLEFSEENDDVVLISPSYYISLYSDDHPSTNGYRWFGEQVAKSMFQIYNMGIKFRNLSPINYILDEENNEIIIEFEIPVPPIRIDTHTIKKQSDYGFCVYGDGKEVGISKVRIVDNSVIITTIGNLSEYRTINVSYAGRYRNGRGNICDSDQWESYYNYWDDTNDNGANGNLSIAQKPKDAKGDYIYGKPYPMQNWLSNFYKVLK